MTESPKRQKALQVARRARALRRAIVMAGHAAGQKSRAVNAKGAGVRLGKFRPEH